MASNKNHMTDGQNEEVNQMVDEPTEADQKILDEIAEEDAAEAGDKPEEDAKPEDDPPPEKKEEGADGADKPEDEGEDPEDDEDVEDVDKKSEDDADKKLDKKQDKKPEEEEGRKPKFVRLEKHRKTRKLLKEAKEEIATLKAKPDQKTPEQRKEAEEAEAKIKQDLADDMGVDVEKLDKILKLSEDKAFKRLKDEMGDKIESLEASQKDATAREEDSKQEDIFKKQFEALEKQFPKEADHIKSIKGKIKELAFSEKYASADLDVIYRGVEGLRSTKSKTVESGKGGSSRGDEEGSDKDFKRILDEDDQAAILKMDSKTFAEFEKYITKHRR